MHLNTIFATLVFYLAVEGVVSWDYTGPLGVDHWGKVNKQCDGKKQSPIHLPESGSKYKKFDPFAFTGYRTRNTAHKFDLKNNGHTIQITLKDYKGMSVKGFGKIFRPWQIHFHWGSNDAVGSEHTMKKDAKQLHPAEMHFVHVNTAYKDVTEALSKSDGLMVFGTAFEVDKSGKNNSFIAKFQKHLKAITLAKTNVDMDSFELHDAFMVPTDKFFHYQGSLTTPPCSEAVQWVVFTTLSGISNAQMAKLRSLRGDTNMTGPPKYLSNNYRPIQPSNGRTIYRSFNSANKAGASFLTVVMFFVVRFI